MPTSSRNSPDFFESSLRIGGIVEAGSPLGTIRSLDGTVLHKLIAPVTGQVAILRTFASVQPGDRLVQLFFPR